MKRTLASLALAVLSGCGGVSGIASVNGESITLGDVAALTSEVTMPPEVLARLLSLLIEYRVAVPAAAELGIQVSGEEISQRVEELTAPLLGDLSYQDWLKTQRITDRAVRSIVELDVLGEKLAAAVPDAIGWRETTLGAAAIRVDERYGSWDPELGAVVPNP